MNAKTQEKEKFKAGKNYQSLSSSLLEAMSIYKIYLPHLKRCYSPYITFLRNVDVSYILKKFLVGRVCKSNLRRARFGRTMKTFFVS